MKLTSWNINSIKARKEHVLKYLENSKPDLLMVQELKGQNFPADEFETLGYKTHAVTQKAYNGVAIFSKIKFDVIKDALDGDKEDEQARYLEIEIENGTRVINIYLPNGNPVPGPKYDYKLSWMARLHTRLKTLIDSDIPFILGGDFNVIPADKDCHSPTAWQGDALFRPETHAAYRRLLNLGLTDAFRVFDTRSDQYTFWDYQAGAWQKDNGIRIDYFLLSPYMADHLETCRINKEPRGWDKPSDHTPIEIDLDLP